MNNNNVTAIMEYYLGTSYHYLGAGLSGIRYQESKSNSESM